MYEYKQLIVKQLLFVNVIIFCLYVFQVFDKNIMS